MYYFKNFLEELSKNTGGEFNLMDECNTTIFHGLPQGTEEKQCIKVRLGNGCEL